MTTVLTSWCGWTCRHAGGNWQRRQSFCVERSPLLSFRRSLPDFQLPRCFKHAIRKDDSPMFFAFIRQSVFHARIARHQVLYCRIREGGVRHIYFYWCVEMHTMICTRFAQIRPGLYRKGDSESNTQQSFPWLIILITLETWKWTYFKVGMPRFCVWSFTAFP